MSPIRLQSALAPRYMTAAATTVCCCLAVRCAPSSGRCHAPHLLPCAGCSVAAAGAEACAYRRVGFWLRRFIAEMILKKNKKSNVKPFMVKNHVSVFVNALIENPAFDSQVCES